MGSFSTGSTRPALLQEGLFEEAQLLRERELEMKAKLVGTLSAVKHAPQHRNAGLVLSQLHRAPVHSAAVHLPGMHPLPCHCTPLCLHTLPANYCLSTATMQSQKSGRQDFSHLVCAGGACHRAQHSSSRCGGG